MKDLSAYYEIARLITAELSETITPEEKGPLAGTTGSKHDHCQE